MAQARGDDYAVRRQHLANLNEEELGERFWQLAHEVVQPLLDLARTHTTPSLERSVLLRMGLDSPTTQGVVKHAQGKGLLGHGAGHCVWRYAKLKNITIDQAGTELARGEGWDELGLYLGEGRGEGYGL